MVRRSIYFEVVFVTVFPTTRWTVILSATSTSRAEYDALLARYSSALVAYARARLNLQIHDAEELVQAFIAAQLEKVPIAERAKKNRGGAARGGLQPGKSRFRWYIKRMLSNFILNWRKRQASKEPPLATNRDVLAVSEGREDKRGELAMDREWARTVLDNSFANLHQSASGKWYEGLVDMLQHHYMDGTELPSSKDLHHIFHKSEENIRTTIHNLRTKLEQFLLIEVRPTVAEDAEDTKKKKRRKTKKRRDAEERAELEYLFRVHGWSSYPYFSHYAQEGIE